MIEQRTDRKLKNHVTDMTKHNKDFGIGPPEKWERSFCYTALPINNLFRGYPNLKQPFSLDEFEGNNSGQRKQSMT